MNNEFPKDHSRVFIWHQFEQFEAACFDRSLKSETKKECFKTLNNVVDIANAFSICCCEDREWMNSRLEEIVEKFPELVG
jgi:hypothetical protein